MAVLLDEVGFALSAPGEKEWSGWLLVEDGLHHVACAHELDHAMERELEANLFVPDTFEEE